MIGGSGGYEVAAGDLRDVIVEALDELTERDFGARLHAHDPALWSEREVDAASIRTRCGWLEAPAAARAALPGWQALADTARADGFRRAVVLGMGGSSLFPLVLSRLEMPRGPGLALHVLDSVVPAAVEAARPLLSADDTLVVVASKSGGTTEALALADLAESWGDPRRMIAVTDPGSALEARAESDGWRAVALGDPNVGGRFSALTVFGLLPATLAGCDVAALLDRADAMAARCAADRPLRTNPGAVLGGLMAACARAGHDVITVDPGPGLAPLVAWIEQLVAESTGKHGVGLWPIADHGAGPGAAAQERAFFGGTAGAGHGIAGDRRPMVGWRHEGASDVLAEAYRWEVATAAAACLLDINPFDEPDVGLSKTLTRRALDRLAAEGRLPWPEALSSDGGLSVMAPVDGTAGAAAPTDTTEAACAAWLRACVGDRRVASLLLYLPVDGANEAAAAALGARLEARIGRPVMVGFGPRYLHATGQLHKGGSDRAHHLLLTCADGPAIRLPGPAGIDLGDLSVAQALADAEALASRGRRVLHLHASPPIGGALGRLAAMLVQAAGKAE